VAASISGVPVTLLFIARICEPAKAHWLIAERFRAAPARLTALERAAGFLQRQMNPGQSAQAKAIIDAAKRAGIAAATLTRARWQVGIQSLKTRAGWAWVPSDR